MDDKESIINNRMDDFWEKYLKQEKPSQDIKMEGNELLAILNSTAAALEVWSQKANNETIDSDMVQLKIQMLKATGLIFRNI